MYVVMDERGWIPNQQTRRCFGGKRNTKYIYNKNYIL